MSEQPIGVVEHYYPKAHAAVVLVTGGVLREHDLIHIVGKHIDVTEPVTSLQINHLPIHEAHEGERVGLRVEVPVPEDAQIYRVFRVGP